MKNRIKILLHKLGYGIEMKRLETKGGLQITHIRKFEAQGKLARFSRKLEKLLK